MKTCENCSSLTDGSYGTGRFCSSGCARSFSTKVKRKVINEKVAAKLMGNKNNGIGYKRLHIYKDCEFCKNKFLSKKTTQRFCNWSCSTSWKNLTLNIGRLGGLKSVISQNRRSKNEKYFADLCATKFKVILNEPLFNGWDADVILPEFKLAILWNGKWHYQKITKDHSLKQVQTRDAIKNEEIKKYGYTPYIIKDLGKYNVDFVNDEFKKLCLFVTNIAG